MSAPPANDPPSAVNGPGFCGKLPSHRDFISRRVAPDLLARWGEWLDIAMEHSREALGETWLATYLSAPIWRFAVSPGCCGERPFLGVLMPSLDAIGRYYPLSILVPADSQSVTAEIAVAATQWYGRVEDLALSCLSDDFDFTRFDGALAGEVLATGSDSASALPQTEPTAGLPRLLGRLLEQHAVSYSLWWTSGSPSMAATSRAFPGLPNGQDFCELLG